MCRQSVIEIGRTPVRRTPRAVSPAAPGLVRHVHAGRYFGVLWFKVFSERGPC